MKKPCRNACKECPYSKNNDTQNNRMFKKGVEKLTEIGVLEDKIHKCHMIETGWDKPTEKNVCVGSLNNKK
ncbi:MAG: hypothetical protein SLAVMIC_01033 [uncultured marine phage]|uniref:Uncharacterized protein n=1 Tax=uncultured marine phage TaxID=707152 RepID=A0A8D9FQQ6_9VIRU|nr:MAG: hypothetical protein SLAVMIC_01033 [uncultured marine phage]